MTPSLANKLAPGALDRHLARTGFGCRQTDQIRRVHHGEPGLREPAAADDDGHDDGAHGVFDRSSTDRGHQPGASHPHGVLARVGSGAALAAGVVAMHPRNQ
jgi:hypothetical protein